MWTTTLTANNFRDGHVLMKRERERERDDGRERESAPLHPQLWASLVVRLACIIFELRSLRASRSLANEIVVLT